MSKARGTTTIRTKKRKDGSIIGSARTTDPSVDLRTVIQAMTPTAQLRKARDAAQPAKVAKKLKVSLIEAEAKTVLERRVAEARNRAPSLRRLATLLESYLTGGEGGPDLAISCLREARAIAEALGDAVTARLTRFEVEDAQVRAKAKKGRSR